MRKIAVRSRRIEYNDGGKTQSCSGNDASPELAASLEYREPNVSQVAVATPKSTTYQDNKQNRRRQPKYNVILWDDNDHTYPYVIRMLGQLFGFPSEKGFLLAQDVDTNGRVICMTTTREHAELKRDQIHAFGADPMLSRSSGSMSAVIEPAE